MNSKPLNDLYISLVQPNVIWENPVENRKHISQLLPKANGHIILLPEMFATGFTMNTKNFAETMQGPTVQWMLQEAQNRNQVIAGSLIIKEDDKENAKDDAINKKYYNRFVWAFPDGHCKWYNKRHLFRMGAEHLHYEPGNKRVIINYAGWRICPLVCYDLRFPAWSRNHQLPLFDLLIYVASWPQVRSFAWEQLLIARAIETQVYTVGVNRVGLDTHGQQHQGGSTVLNYMGQPMAAAPSNNEEVVINATINWEAQNEFRAKFGAWRDADTFNVE